MYRRLAATLALVLLASSCKIQRTPREYIDRRDPVVTEFALAEEQVRNRLTLLEAALNEQDAAGALAALGPAAQMRVIGPGPEEYLPGDHQIAVILERFAELDPLSVSLRDVQIEVGPRASVAWFATHLEVQRSPAAAGPPPRLRFTGVYVLREGSWVLAQAHLSLPADTPTAAGRAQYPSAPPPAEAG